jgi:hypothetical protein
MVDEPQSRRTIPDQRNAISFRFQVVLDTDGKMLFIFDNEDVIHAVVTSLYLNESQSLDEP